MTCCPTCGNPMPPLNSKGKPRQFCSGRCSNIQHLPPKIRDQYTEEVEHLTSFGTSPHVMCDQLGVTPSALARALQREGRHDLARPIERYARALRRAAA